MSGGRYTMRGRATQGRAFAGFVLAYRISVIPPTPATGNGRWAMGGYSFQGQAFATWALANNDAQTTGYVTKRLLLRGTNTAPKGLSGVDLLTLPLSSTSRFKAIITGSSE